MCSWLWKSCRGRLECACLQWRVPFCPGPVEAASADGYLVGSGRHRSSQSERVAIQIHGVWLAAVDQRRRGGQRAQSFPSDGAQRRYSRSLDFAYMSYQEARRGAVTLFSDIIYTKNTDSGSFARSYEFSRHVSGIAWRCDIVRLPAVDRRVRRHVRDQPLAHGARIPVKPMRGSIFYAGGRYWHQELDVDVDDQLARSTSMVSSFRVPGRWRSRVVSTGSIRSSVRA